MRTLILAIAAHAASCGTPIAHRPIEPTSTIRVCGNDVALDATALHCWIPENDLVNLSRLRQLRVLVVNTYATDLSPLAKLTKLEVLELGTRAGRTADLAALATLRGLQGLRYDGRFREPERSCESIGHDGYHRHACEIDLDVSPPTTLDVSVFRLLPNLRALSVSGVEIADMSPIGALTELRFLELAIRKRGDIAVLSALNKLQRADLQGDLGDLAPLGACKDLAVLLLRWHDPVIPDVRSLAVLDRLQVLVLDGENLSHEEALGSIASLEQLMLINTRLRAATALTRLAALRTLHLHNTELRDFLPFSQLSALKEVRVFQTESNSEGPPSWFQPAIGALRTARPDLRVDVSAEVALPPDGFWPRFGGRPGTGAQRVDRSGAGDTSLAR